MPLQTEIRVMTVDDHPLLRAGISSAVNAQSGMTVVAEAAGGEEAVCLHRQCKPDVTLMDLRMPGMSGIEAIAAIRRESPQARVIVLTTYGGDVQAKRAFEAGASGYLLKHMLGAEMIETIRRVHAGQRSIPAEIATEIAEHAGDESLTEREVEVLRSVAAGNSNKIVAADMSLSEHTVKGHLRNILSKLQASDRTDAVMIALKRGIFEV
ncbi:MAG TPA: response regulator transcription factor [Acidobacteriaceae bacterium]